MVSRSLETSVGGERSRRLSWLKAALGMLSLVACLAATGGCAAAYNCYRCSSPATAYRPHPPLPHTPLYRPLEPQSTVSACGLRPAFGE